MSRLPKVANSHRRLYPSDLSDREWEAIKPLLPAPKGFGRPRTVDLREILNAVFYVQRSGCQWGSADAQFVVANAESVLVSFADTGGFATARLEGIRPRVTP